MTPTELPEGIRLALLAVHRRTRRAAAIQGTCRLLLVLAIAAFAAIVADACLGFPPFVRGSLLLVWVAIAAIEVRRRIVEPLREPPDYAALARAAEAACPGLDERLSTVVSLVGRPGEGSPELVGELRLETERRTVRLDPSRIASLKPGTTFVALTALTLAIVLIPSMLVSRSGEYSRRFFAPWSAKPDPGWTLAVATGDANVRRGEAVTLSAFVEPTRADAVLPANAELLIRQNGRVSRQPMVRENLVVFHARRTAVTEDFEYSVTAGDAVAPWHSVRAVDPPALAEFRATVLLPTYARTVGREPTRIEALVDLETLVHSRLSLECRFDPLPEAAYIEWTPANPASSSRRFPLPISGGGSVLPVAESGKMRLVLEGPPGIRTDYPPRTIAALPDLAPAFETVAGFPGRTGQIRPGEPIVVRAEVRDDRRVESVEVEYRTATRPPQRIALTLERRAGGSVLATGTVDPVALAAGAREVQLRLVATDNRSIPEAKLDPQQTRYPASEEWATIHLRADALPLAEQEIAARRDGIDERLRRQIDALAKLSKIAERLKASTAARQPWTAKHSVDLADLRQRLADSGSELRELARETATTPELAGFAERIGRVAAVELAEADAGLRRAETEVERSRPLEVAENRLIDAVRRLEELRKENDRLAEVRRDLVRLEGLATRQEAAAAGAGAAKPSAESLAELLAEQKRLEEELARLQRDSPTLESATRMQTRARAGELAARSEDLGLQIRELDRTMLRAGGERLRRRLEELLRQQQGLADKLGRFDRDTAALTRSIQSRPLQSADAAAAIDDLTQNRTEGALLKMARVELDLSRLAADLERAAADARDTKEALRQLARLQEELRHATAGLRQQPTANTPAAREGLGLEQRAIGRAVAALKLPSDDRLDRLRKEFVGHHDGSVGGIAGNRLDDADGSMNLARSALDRLADLLPDRAARLAKSRTELNKLRYKQESVRVSTEAILKPFQAREPEVLPTEATARLADGVRRQKAILDDFGGLDLPGHEERDVRVRRAILEAIEDLESGRVGEIGQSQIRLKRELDRLEVAIGGGKPADEEIARLAGRQREIADRLASRPKNEEIDKGLRRELSERQAILADSLPPLAAVPESPQLYHEAREATKLADARLRGLAPLAEAVRDTLGAAAALEKLSRTVEGRDRASERAARLRGKQSEIAVDCEGLVRKPDAKKGEELRLAQERLADELRSVRPGPFAAEKRRAVESVAKTRDIASTEVQARNRKAAVESVREFADKLEGQPPVEPIPATVAEESATKKAARQARELAVEQQKLREETSRAIDELRRPTPPSEPAATGLMATVEKQRKIAREIAELADRLHRAQGPQALEPGQASEAATAAGQAAKHLQNGEVAPASEAAQLSVRRLRELAVGRAPMPIREAAAALEVRQQAIVAQLAEMSPTEASRSARATRKERQAELREQAETLTEELNRLRDRGGDKTALAEEIGKSAAATKRAADDLGKAAMRQGDGDEPGASMARQQAADGLEMAGKSLKAAVPAPTPAAESTREAGALLAGAMAKMQAAIGQLPTDPTGAAAAMSESAKNLRGAAKRLGQPRETPSSATAPKDGQQPGAGSADGSQTGAPDLRIPGADAAKYAGRSWGELPGELKTKLLQDLKERYGEDYARSIRLYFEQLATRRE